MYHRPYLGGLWCIAITRPRKRMVWVLFFSVISDNKYKHWGLRWPIKHAGNQTIISQRDGRANSENMLVCQACVGTVIYLICECILLWTLRTRDALGSEIERLASRNRDNGDNTLQLSKCFYLWLVKKKKKKDQSFSLTSISMSTHMNMPVHIYSIADRSFIWCESCTCMRVCVCACAHVCIYVCGFLWVLL